MTSPRAVRLVRVPDLRAAHRAVALLACGGDVVSTRGRAVLVPSQTAGDELRRTLERLVLGGELAGLAQLARRLDVPETGARRVVALPDILARDQWYARLRDAFAGDAAWLSSYDREVLLREAAAEAVAVGHSPPFQLRPALVAEMLAFYETLRRLRTSVDDFERLLVGELEPSAEYDRGARRLLRQTRFLVSSFRGYEARIGRAAAIDEHRLQALAALASRPQPFRHLVVTVPDHCVDPSGLWPADFDLLTRLPGLERIDVVLTEELLATGLFERLHERLPGLDTVALRELGTPGPVLVAPSVVDARHHSSRDREAEAADVARRIVLRHRGTAQGDREPDRDAVPPLDDTAVVYQRPLPYLYVARQVLEAARVPCELTDALPLAAEPYAAALDLVVSFVTGGFARAAGLALLRAPDLRAAGPDGDVPTPADVAALERWLDERGATGGREGWAGAAAELTGMAGRLTPDRGAASAASAIAEAAAALAALEVEAPPTEHLRVLRTFLDAHEAPVSADGILAARGLRARAAIHEVLAQIDAAERRHGDRPGPFAALALTIRRWIEDRTFRVPAGEGGVRLVDAQTAAYGEYDAVHLVGLVEGEWPASSRQSVFYPGSLLRDLGWTRDADRGTAARATFRDLLRLGAREVSVSAFTLEDDAIVRPSPLLEELDQVPLEVVRPAGSDSRLLDVEALWHDPVETPAARGQASAWLALRRSRSPASAPRFHGTTGPWERSAASVTAVETYLECPFRYFARRVLALEEERPDEVLLGPLARGRFIHAVFQRFFGRWQEQGQGAVTAQNLDAARARFRSVVDELLPQLPEPDRLLERARLLGSAARTGFGERVLTLEASEGREVLERRLEHELHGTYVLDTDDGARTVAVRGKADRIDLLTDGSLRLIDYKTGRAPRADRALQLPVYAACAERQLAGYGGRAWRVARAGYVALAESTIFVPVIARAEARDRVLRDGATRFVRAVEAIAAGHFPPRPAELRLCASCAFAAVCRKDYVDA